MSYLTLRTPWEEDSRISDFNSHIPLNTAEMSRRLLSREEVKEDQKLTSRQRAGRRVRGSLAAINPLRQDRIRLEDSVVEAEWVKARVYSMSYRLVK